MLCVCVLVRGLMAGQQSSLSCRRQAPVYHHYIVYLHCTAVLYSTLQCYTVHCSAIQYTAVLYSTLQCYTVHCSAIQYTAVLYSTLQCYTVHCSAIHCSTVLYTTLQCYTWHTPVTAVGLCAIRCLLVRCRASMGRA